MTATDITRPPAAAESRPGHRARVGVFGIGLATYWPQFEGLKERIEGYQRRVEERVAALGGEVVSAGLVDSAQAARAAGDRFASAPWARRWSRPAWSTRRRARVRPVSASRPSAWTWCSATP